MLVGAVLRAWPGRCTWPRATPSGCAGMVAIAPACGLAIRAARSATHYRWDEPLDTDAGLGEVQQVLLAGGRLRRLRRVLLRRRCSPSRTPPSRSRTASAGRTRSTRQTLVDTTAGRLGCDGAVCARSSRSARGCSARCSSCTAPTTGSARWPIGERLAELTGGSLVAARGRRPRPAARDPVLVNHLIRASSSTGSVARPARRAASPGVRAARAAAPGALPVLADRARPRPPRRGHRRASCAGCTRTCRSTGWPSIPVTRVLAAAGETHAPGVGLAGQRVRAHRERVRRARPARVPGDPADGRDPGQQLHGVRRRGRRRSATTWSSATRPGTSTTSCTRTRSSSGSPFAWMTDFVGWLPMPDGGDRRGGAHRRLQRRDARAAGPVPRGCATGRSSSATRTTSCRDRFGPGLPPIRDWTERELRLRRLRHRVRPGRARGDRDGAAGAARATPTDERLCVVTVGGSGVGDALLRRVLDAVPLAAAAGSRTCGSSSSPARGSTRRRCRRPTGVEVRRATCRTCTGTSRRATSPSCRAG